MIRLITFIFFVFIFQNANAQNNDLSKEKKSAVHDDNYSLENYLRIRGAGSPVYSYDGKKVFIKTSMNGTSQIWVIDKPMQLPKQITFFHNRIKYYSYSPLEDLIVFQKDIDGAENDQIFLMKPDGSDVLNITNDNDVKYRFAFWSDTEKVFYYYSNERSSAYYDIYSYNYETNTKSLVFLSDNRNYPGNISPDGKYVVISRSYANFDNDLFLLDLITGELTLLTLYTANSDPCRTYARAWTKDSKGFYYISDYNRNFMNLGYYDLDNKKFKYIDEMPELSFIVSKENLNKDITKIEFSKDMSSVAYSVNYEGIDEMVIKDMRNKTNVPLPDELKRSHMRDFSFSNDGEKIIIAFNNYNIPTVVYQYEISTSKLEQFTKPYLNGIPQDSFIKPELVKIKSFDSLEVSGFFYLPQGAKKDSNLPCIIYIHGGPEGQSDIGFNPVFQYYLSKGFAILAPNVRGSRGKGKHFKSLDDVRLRENSVADIAEFTKYIISTGYINKNKIVIMGTSYGGYMTLACLTLYPEIYAAGVCRVGISNFITFLMNTADYRRSVREAEYGNLQYDFGFLESISPIHKVDRIKAPLLLIHGANDPRVPVSEAEQIYEAIKSRDGIVEFLKFENEGHGISKSENKLEAYKRIVEFLDEYVKKD
ncbi:MAG: S9 family peptidase [Ignavibacteria bacterium]|nr:S9 family peptidase [Ignavibacteria bacterium]